MKQGFSTDDTSAWQAYRTSLFHFVLKRVANPADAEDLVQEVLVRAYTNFATLQDATKVRPWLYQIARNAIIDFYRRHFRREGSDEHYLRASRVATGAAW